MADAAFFANPITLNGKVYFASDFHFGAPDEAASRAREEAVVNWLDRISHDADHLFLLGDVFDFWFEYRDVMPKSNLLFLSKLLELSKKGVKIYFFTGNHDMWVKDYFTKEMGIRIFRKEQGFIINGKRCLLGHGDGLDPNERGYLFIKKLFASRLCIAIYGALPPRWAFGIAQKCSKSSRKSSTAKRTDTPNEKATLDFIRQTCQQEPTDYFFFGHRHLPFEIKVSETTTYFNTGDWLFHSSYIAWAPDDTPQLHEFFQEIN